MRYGTLLHTTLCSLLIGPFASPTIASENAALQAEINRLKAENSKLQEHNEYARKQITDLKTELEHLRTSPPAVATEETKPRSPWKVDVAIGGNFNRGNTDSSLLNVRSAAVRSTDTDRLSLAASGDLGENNGNRNAEKASGSANYRRIIHDRLYWLINFGGEYDALANLDYRLNLSPGIGYYLVKTDPFELSLEAGPAYVLEQFTDRAARSMASARVAQELLWRINGNFSVFQNSELLVSFEDTEDWLLNAEAGIESRLTETISMRLTGRNRHVNEPAPGREKNDLSVIASLVYRFK